MLLKWHSASSYSFKRTLRSSFKMAEYMHSDFYIVNWSQSLYVEFIVKSFICLSQMKKPSNSFPPNPEKKILTLPCSPHPQSMRQGASLAQIKMSSSASVSTRENRGTPEQQCEQWEGWWCQQSQGEEEPECVCVFQCIFFYLDVTCQLGQLSSEVWVVIYFFGSC